jgi:hypothetical protein
MRREAKRRKEHVRWKREWRRTHQGRANYELRWSREIELKGPAVFSMTRNPEGMNRFFRQLTQERKWGRSVFVDLGDIKELTFDAIAVLLARISDRRFGVEGVRGREPNNPKLRDLLIASGFYGHVRRDGGMDASAQRGQMIREGGRKAMGESALMLRRRVSSKPLRGVYRILMDSMNNTFDHATSDEGRAQGRSVKWWASAYVDPERRRGYFAFVDNGVGIIESINLKGFRALADMLGVVDSASTLRAIFNGEIESRTALPNRGHGLPGIREVAERGDVQDLRVITNDVFADVSRGEYRTLRHSYDGTVLTWEVDLA